MNPVFDENGMLYIPYQAQIGETEVGGVIDAEEFTAIFDEKTYTEALAMFQEESQWYRSLQKLKQDGLI
jgi:hypothetical protein